MMQMQSLNWCDPLALASAVDEPYWALLHTSAPGRGRYSYLAHRLVEQLSAPDWQSLAPHISQRLAPFDRCWFGYLGYGLKNSLEALPADTPGPFALPHAWLMRFGAIYIFDHEKKQLQYWRNDGAAPLTAHDNTHTPHLPHVCELRSNMTRTQYLQHVKTILAHIQAGDLYQANLTRKFRGRFAQPADGFSLFRALCIQSPAPYSAYLRFGDTQLISSSPELFLSIDSHGKMQAAPIKGTLPRGATAEQDAALRHTLHASEKNRAENLMIVDLMRHDFARACVPGTVRVPSLFDITSHAQVHHMSSRIEGQLRADCSSLSAVAQCFPPGSMTGAPKIRAMQLCSALEQEERGPYSGALGFFAGDGSAELSVIIRTLVLRADQFEFQVGGGIVADSTPDGELSELLDKASGMAKTLGISRESLETL